MGSLGPISLIVLVKEFSFGFRVLKVMQDLYHQQ